MSEKIRINIVPSFHYDVAYLKTEEAYLHQCIDNIHQALNIMDQYENYTFTLEQVILVREYWNRHPENRDKLKKYVLEGRLCIAPGMWVVPDMNMPDGESMFMQIKIGKDWLEEKLGISPDVCYIADCWGHHAQLPQMMRQSGYDYYIFWRCMRRDVLMNDFIWKGLDGTKIKTHWLARGYGGVSFPDEAEKVNALDIDFAGSSLKEIVEKSEEIRQYGPDNPVLIFNGGDFAYPQISAPQTVSKYESDNYDINFSNVKSHMQSVNWEKVKETGGEFNTSQQGTFTTNILIKQTIRKLINQTHALEKFEVVAGKGDIDTLTIWESLLKQQFHDIICGSICDGAVLDSYNEMRQAQKMIYAKKEMTEDADGELCFFNPLEIKRREVVNFADKKHIIDIEPLGFAKVDETKALTEIPMASLPLNFENSYYKAEINAQGYVISLMDKKTGEVVTHGSEIPFGEISMQMDYGDVWLNFEGPISGGSIEASLTQNKRDPYFRGFKDGIVDKRTHGAIFVSAKVAEQNEQELVIEQKTLIKFWKISVPVTTTITFSKSTAMIKYRTKFIPSGKHYRIRAAFPTCIKNGTIRHEIPYGIVEREQAEFPCQNWCDYSNDAKGLALINKGIPANNVDDGIMMLTLFRSVAMEYKTDSVLSYNEGRPQCFEYAVMPHFAGDDVEIINNARRFNQPLNVCRVRKGLLEEKPCFYTDMPNIILSGLRFQKGAIFMRLYEALGEGKTKCVLKIPDDVAYYRIADGLQKALGEKVNCQGEIDLTFKAFEIVNILLYRE